MFTSTKLEKNIRTMDYDHFKRALIKIATRKYPWRNGDKPGMCGTTGEVASMARLLRRFWGSGGSVWRRLVRVCSWLAQQQRGLGTSPLHVSSSGGCAAQAREMESWSHSGQTSHLVRPWWCHAGRVVCVGLAEAYHGTACQGSVRGARLANMWSNRSDTCGVLVCLTNLQAGCSRAKYRAGHARPETCRTCCQAGVQEVPHRGPQRGVLLQHGHQGEAVAQAVPAAWQQRRGGNPHADQR